MERKTSGQAPRRRQQRRGEQARQGKPLRQRAIRPLLRCRPTGGRGPLPVRHLFNLPRGRGPSQTPKFLSPGPPSPWLPAPLKAKKFCRFCGEPWVQPRGCKGRSPLHEITLAPPSPPGKGAGRIGGEKASHPAGDSSGEASRRGGAAPPPARDTPPAPVPPGFSPGMQGAKPLA